MVAALISRFVLHSISSRSAVTAIAFRQHAELWPSLWHGPEPGLHLSPPSASGGGDGLRCVPLLTRRILNRRTCRTVCPGVDIRGKYGSMMSAHCANPAVLRPDWKALHERMKGHESTVAITVVAGSSRGPYPTLRRRLLRRVEQLDSHGSNPAGDHHAAANEQRNYGCRVSKAV